MAAIGNCMRIPHRGFKLNNKPAKSESLISTQERNHVGLNIFSQNSLTITNKCFQPIPPQRTSSHTRTHLLVKFSEASQTTLVCAVWCDYCHQLKLKVPVFVCVDMYKSVVLANIVPTHALTNLLLSHGNCLW